MCSQCRVILLGRKAFLTRGSAPPRRASLAGVPASTDLFRPRARCGEALPKPQTRTEPANAAANEWFCLEDRQFVQIDKIVVLEV